MTLEEEIAALKRIAAFHREQPEKPQDFAYTFAYHAQIQTQKLPPDWYSVQPTYDNSPPYFIDEISWGDGGITVKSSKVTAKQKKPSFPLPTKKKAPLCSAYCPRCHLLVTVEVISSDKAVRIPPHPACDFNGIHWYHDCRCSACGRGSLISVAYEGRSILIEEHLELMADIICGGRTCPHKYV